TQTPSGATGALPTTPTAMTGPDGTAASQFFLGDTNGQYQVTAKCLSPQNCTPSSVLFTETACHVDPSNLTVTVVNGTELLAQFTPVGGLSAIQAVCGLVGFNFKSQVVSDPDPPISALTRLPLVAPYFDPPLGGYLGQP